jgi:hypothetical protein
MIIVNFSTPQFAKGQKRLSDSLNGYNKLLFTDYAQIKSPTHEQSPYEFKVHAIEKAFEVDDIVLWCDSSLYRVGDLSKIQTIIEETGFFGEESGHYCYDWANPRCRDYHQLRKEEGLIMYSAGLTGINIKHPVAAAFFSQWKKSALKGMFKGDWSNHRHDMVNASIIAQRLGLPFQRGGTHMAYIGDGYQKPNEGVVFHLQGLV